MKRGWMVGLGVALVLIAIGAYFFWPRSVPPQLPPPVPVASPAPIAPVAPIAPPEPAIRHPIQAPTGAVELPPIGQADEFVRERITGFLGAKTVQTHVQVENFARRVVATVDNLSRSLAPPRMWPIQRTPGRFAVEPSGNGSAIGPKNAARYAAFVALVESVDTHRAVALYRQLYPLFQRAYEEIGYPGKPFNDRLVAVIDLLLETPEPTGAVMVEQPQVHGPLKPTRPWLLYRYSDPELERLSSGQKILLRVGPENARRLKAKLAEFRKLIAADTATR